MCHSRHVDSYLIDDHRRPTQICIGHLGRTQSCNPEHFSLGGYLGPPVGGVDSPSDANLSPPSSGRVDPPTGVVGL